MNILSSYNYTLFFIMLLAACSVEAMELEKTNVPKAAPTQIERNRVLPLKLLAARRVAAHFDPEVNYQKALSVLHNGLKIQTPDGVVNDVNIHIEVAPLIARQLTHRAAATLEPILDTQEPEEFECNYYPANDTVYIPDQGVMKWSRISDPVFFPSRPELHTKKLKYKRVLVSPDQSLGMSKEGKNTIKIWNLATGSLVNTLSISDSTALHVKPCGITANNAIATVEYSIPSPEEHGGIRHVCGINIHTGTPEYDIEGNIAVHLDNYSVSYPAISNHGTIMLMNSRNREDRSSASDRYSVHTMLTGEQTIQLEAKGFRTFILSPHDDYAVSIDRPVLHVWDLATGKCMRTFPHENHSGNICISNEGCLIAIGYDPELKVWNVYTGQLLATFKTPSSFSGLNCAQFCANDERLVTFTDERFKNLGKDVIHIWNIKTQSLVAQKPLRVQYTSNDQNVTILSNLRVWQDDSYAIATPFHGDTTKERNTLPPYVNKKMLYALAPLLAKQATLKQICALLILEYNRKHGQFLEPEACDIMQSSENTLLLNILQKRYIDYSRQLELSRRERIRNSIKTGVFGGFGLLLYLSRT